MIGTININCNAANPNMPLKTIFAFVNSPTSIRIIDTPKKIGTWNITSVKIQATYPDNSIVSANCVLTGGCWTGTIQGSLSVGKSLNGYMVTADGIDENGNNITGYILGKGDVVILDADSRTVIDDKMYYLHLLDNVPTNPQKGDVVQSDDNWLIYDGSDWALFGGASWGQITGDITEQEDLNQKFTDIDVAFDSVDGSIVALQSQINDNTFDISRIDEAITPTAPSTEAEENAIAGAKSTADFVNSSINNFAAYYITRDEDGNAFYNHYDLESAEVYYSGGEVRTPTKNDYCIVIADEDHTTSLGDPTTRYTFDGGQWAYQYTVNNSPLTQAQINALNSGITSAKVAQIDNASTKDYVDNQISAKASKFLWMHDRDDGYIPLPTISADGDFYIYRHYSNGMKQGVQIPGRPTGDKTSFSITEINRGYYDANYGRYTYKTMPIVGTDAYDSITLSGSDVKWKPLTTVGTLFSEWLYSDTLSARNLISANVKSPFVQKNQLSNVTVFSGKYEDGTIFDISCLSPM